MFSRMEKLGDQNERPLDSKARRIEFAIVMSLAAAAVIWLAARGCREPTMEEILGGELRAGIQGRRTVLLDMDESLRLSAGGGGGIFGVLAGGPRSAPSMAGAASALSALSPNYNFILISARPESLRVSTEQWLEVNGLPRVPSLLSPKPSTTQVGQAESKLQIIRRLKELGFNTWACVCERPQDAVAYVREGLICAMIIESKHDPDLRVILRTGEDAESDKEAFSRLFLFDIANDSSPLWERIRTAISDDFRSARPRPALN